MASADMDQAGEEPAKLVKILQILSSSLALTLATKLGSCLCTAVVYDKK